MIQVHRHTFPGYTPNRPGPGSARGRRLVAVTLTVGLLSFLAPGRLLAHFGVTQAQKDAFKKVAEDAGKDAEKICSWFEHAALGCLIEGIPALCPLAVWYGYVCKKATDQQKQFEEMAKDPPDPNFMAIAQPTIPGFPSSPPDLGVGEPATLAFASLLRNQLAVVGYTEALLHTIERAQGAFIAGDSFWQSKQLDAAALYRGTLAVLLNDQIKLRGELKDILAAAGLPSVPAGTAEQIAALKALLAETGFPIEFQEDLEALGADSSVLNDLCQQILSSEFGAPPADILGALTEPALIQALLELARELGFANELVTFESLLSTFTISSSSNGCPAGFPERFLFQARLTNTSSLSLPSPKARVASLTNGNLLRNADGGPAGVGAWLSVPKLGGLADGTLDPDEFTDVDFEICLHNRNAFEFSVDVIQSCVSSGCVLEAP